MHRRFSSVFLAVLALAGALVAAPARAELTVDTTFDLDGFSPVNFDIDIDSVQDVAVDANGRLWLVGVSRQDLIDLLAIVLLDEDGGKNSTLVALPGGEPASGGGGIGRAVAIQPDDGKVVVAGSWNDNTGLGNLLMVVRLLPNGTFDETFGHLGTVLVNFPEIASAVAEAVAIDDEGRILVAGGSNNPGTVRGFVMRLSPLGEVDETFGTEGVASFANPTTPGSRMVMESVQQVTGGKILAAGGSEDLIAVRLTDNGALDPTFSGDGIAEVNVGVETLGNLQLKTSEVTHSCAVQPDGRILIGGQSESSTSRRAVMTRLTATGALDTTFGVNGIFKIDNAPNNSAVFDIALREGGDFVIAGSNLKPTQVSRNANLQSGVFGVFPSLTTTSLVPLPDGRVVGAADQILSGSDVQFVAWRVTATELEDPDCTQCGELSGDCRVNSSDAFIALKMAVGQLPKDPQADMDGNGAVTASDSLKILKIAVGSDGPVFGCQP